MTTVTKQYYFHDYAGCVSRHQSRITKTVVGIYHSEQSGYESDPEIPWVTLCEDHGFLVGHPTLALARQWAPDPTGWCDECRQAAAIASGNLPPRGEG